MSTLVNETYTRADENPIAAPWTKHGTGTAIFQLSSNQLRGDLSDVDVCFYDWTGTAPSSADYTVSGDLTVDGSDAGGVIGRRVANGTDDNYYAVILTTTALTLLVRNAGGNTTLGTPFVVSLTNATVHSIKLSMQGTTIKAFLDGVEQISVTDATLSAVGFPGVRNFVFNGLDNFLVEDFGSVSPARLVDLMHRPFWQTLMSM